MPADLSRARDLANAATPGPWKYDITADRKWGEVWDENDDRPVARLHDDDTGEFVAWCRTGVPDLLDEVEQLRAQVEEQTVRADHEDRCAVRNHKNARFWRGEYERTRDERESAVAEIGRLRDNPVARRMKAERDAAVAKLNAVRDLLSTVSGPAYDKDGNYVGAASGNALEHRTVGSHRAWSHEAEEWCYPDAPCSACDRPVDPTELRAVLDRQEQQP